MNRNFTDFVAQGVPFLSGSRCACPHVEGCNLYQSPEDKRKLLETNLEFQKKSVQSTEEELAKLKEETP